MIYNQLEKLASAIRNNVVSGLKGYHTNLSFSIEQICSDIVDERLQILKEYSLKGILPLKDLYISINCIPIDCKSIDKCRCQGESMEDPSAHFEIPQIVNDYGNKSIEYLGSPDKQYPFIVYSRSALNPQYNKDHGLANGLGHKNTVQITVDCYSDKYLESLEVANAFRHALEGKGWKDKDIYIDYFELVSVSENTDGESYFMQTLVFQTEVK